MRFDFDFRWILPPRLGQQIDQDLQTSIPRDLLMLTSVFVDFHCFCANFNFQNVQKYGFSFGKTMIFPKSTFLSSHRFFIDLGVNLLAFSSQNPEKLPKIEFQRHQKSIRFSHRCLYRFFIQLGRYLARIWTNLEAIWAI